MFWVWGGQELILILSENAEVDYAMLKNHRDKKDFNFEKPI